MVSNDPERRNFLNLDYAAVKTVHEGMRDVVHSSYGTGKRGSLSYTVLCGKTGTAQWGPGGLEQRLAWFSGFFPFDNPRYAFAALYEGKPHEELSGGRKAAPMVSAFFERFKSDIKLVIKPPARAMVIDEAEEDTYTQEGEVQELGALTSEVLSEGVEKASDSQQLFPGGEEAPPSSPVTEGASPAVAEEIPEQSETYYDGFVSGDDSLQSLDDVNKQDEDRRRREEQAAESGENTSDDDDVPSAVIVDEEAESNEKASDDDEIPSAVIVDEAAESNEKTSDDDEVPSAVIVDEAAESSENTSNDDEAPRAVTVEE